MEHDVFISYSSRNQTTANAICHILEQHGIRCWIAPRDLIGGEKYGDVIEEAIKTCKIFVIIFSEEAKISPWVESELNIAFTEKKVIIPFKIDNSTLVGEMRLMLNNKHWIDAYPNPEKKFEDLIKAVSLSLDRKSSSGLNSIIYEKKNKYRIITNSIRIILLIALIICGISLIYNNKIYINESNKNKSDSIEFIRKEIIDSIKNEKTTFKKNINSLSENIYINDVKKVKQNSIKNIDTSNNAMEADVSKPITVNVISKKDNDDILKSDSLYLLGYKNLYGKIGYKGVKSPIDLDKAIYYLKLSLNINPNNMKAIEALKWAKKLYETEHNNYVQLSVD